MNKDKNDNVWGFYVILSVIMIILVFGGLIINHYLMDNDGMLCIDRDINEEMDGLRKYIDDKFDNLVNDKYDEIKVYFEILKADLYQNMDGKCINMNMHNAWNQQKDSKYDDIIVI